MKTLIILMLSCTSAFAGEKLVPISSGETNWISYGLFCLIGDSRSASNEAAGKCLVLALRNDGAKWVDFTGVTVKDFVLRNAKGHQMEVYLRTPPQGMAYGEATVVQLVVADTGDAQEPWTLHFTSKRTAAVPIDLTITDIKPRKE